MPDTNIGNNLLKYSIYIFLQYNGFNPILITLKSECNSYFLGKYLNLKEITNYNTELSENEYDILMVNSDQCWSYTFKNILSIGFLSFAINWKIPKFVYAASLGHDSWNVSNDIISSAKSLVKQFTGISVREETSIEIIKKKLGVEPYFVLDPTLLLNKSDYMKIITNYSSDIDLKKDYICAYILDESKIITDFIGNASQELKYDILYIRSNCNNYIEKFILSFDICKSVITDSFHGTIFSLIFDKPFITFINKRRGIARFFSLNQTFELYNRLIFPRIFNREDIYLLKNVANYNKTKFHILKEKSIHFLKQNLGLVK